MKKLFLLITVIFVTVAVIAQSPANPFPKTIVVSGSAEMEIIPDQIYVNIELREYQKKGEDKKDIETIKTKFIESCKAAGIPDSSVSIISYSGANDYYWLRKKKKSPDLLSGITYQVIFKNSKQMDDLVEKLDDEATRSFRIVNTTHTKMTEFRKTLKIEAVKAAKAKGIYLTDAIGEKLGTAITIREPEEDDDRSTYRSNSNGYVSNTLNIVSQARVRSEASVMDQEVAVAFSKIKLRYEVNVTFAVQ